MRMPCGKGAALRWFSERIESAEVPIFVQVSVADWRTDPEAVLAVCERRFGAEIVAVRSDAELEDQWHASRAGEFCSVLDVVPSQRAQAIEQVAQSLPGHAQDGILIQHMVPQPRWVGVVSTHRISDGAPWYCMELARDDAAAVTGGRATGRQFAVARHSASQRPRDGGMEHAALALILEVEDLAGHQPVEIEFALHARDGGCWHAYLLQVRPIAAARQWPASRPSPADARLPSLDFLLEPDPIPEIAGKRTVLSLMSDWNPAELLGTHPRPLALSLFDLLIGEGVWWQARQVLGYAGTAPQPVSLLRVLQGRPFVDVRRSANALLPQGLERADRQVLVDHWMDQLVAEPALHDKVEFRVFRTVQDFSAAAQETPGLSRAAQSRWEAALHDLTVRIMAARPSAPLSRWSAVMAELADDDLRGEDWQRLLQRCRQGTLAFAVLARVAFAAEAQLRSAVWRGALLPERALAIRAAALSAPTHACEAMPAWSHLRPGTFDITQSTWSSDATWRQGPQKTKRMSPSFDLTAPESRALQALAREAGLPHESGQWVRFVQESSRAREWSKFVFSRHLSAALEDIAALVDAVGLKREDASWLTLAVLREGMALPPDGRARHWRAEAERAREQHRLEANTLTSPVLRSPADRDIADSLGTLPNFVGARRIHGHLVVLDDSSARAMPGLAGAVVLVRNADPGFDWLFDHGILGLITEWGGANSHMAIRCAEFGLSAAIGCGSAVHARALGSRCATIDPTSESLWFE